MFNNVVVNYVDLCRADRDEELMLMIAYYDNDKLYHDKTLDELYIILDSEINNYIGCLEDYNIIVNKLVEERNVLDSSTDSLYKAKSKCLDLEHCFINIRYIEWCIKKLDFKFESSIDKEEDYRMYLIGIV